jgi:hypothetical protein
MICTLGKYNLNQVEDYEMVGACSVNWGEDERAWEALYYKLEGCGLEIR